MGKKKHVLKPFSEKKQKEYERIARLQWGPDLVNESVRRWESYGKDGQEAVMKEGNRVYTDLIDVMKAGVPATDERAQAILNRWHNHIRSFYEPTLEILRGLGEMYSADPAFRATFDKFHPDLADYLTEGIRQYVDDLETAEIERMIAADQSDDAGLER